MIALSRLLRAPAACFTAAALLLPSLAHATTPFEILPGSTFSYFVSGFSPVPDCDGNDDRQCDFGVTGTFEFDGVAITDADLTLTSPLTVDPVLPGQLTTADRVEDFIEGLTWIAVPPFPPLQVFEATNLPGSGTLTLAFTTPPQGDGTGFLTGGYDSRPIDGDGVAFDWALRVIPEPGAGVMVLTAIAAAAARRR